MIYSKDKSFKYVILEYTLTLIINSIVLILASKIFKGFYIQSFGYAIITSLVISLLSSTVKPFLKLIFLPVTVITTGIFYPFINLLMLYLVSFIFGSNFVIHGLWIPLLISILISVMNLLLEGLVFKPVLERGRK